MQGITMPSGNLIDFVECQLLHTLKIESCPRASLVTVVLRWGARMSATTHVIFKMKTLTRRFSWMEY